MVVLFYMRHTLAFLIYGRLLLFLLSLMSFSLILHTFSPINLRNHRPLVSSHIASEPYIVMLENAIDHSRKLNRRLVPCLVSQVNLQGCVKSSH
jgi:hypothetical protein